MSAPIPHHKLSDLVCRGCDPWALEGFSAAIDHNALLIELDDAGGESAAQAVLAERLSELPCPVLGLRTGATLPPALLAGCDVVLDDLREFSLLLRNIERHPVAAATLVQVLRHNARSSVHDGLLLESLAFGTLQAGADFRRYLDERRDHAPPPNTNEQPLLLPRTANQLTIIFNRPHARNAYSAALRDALHEALMLVAADDSISAVVVRGAGDCFCTGGDLAEFGLTQDPAQAHLIRMSRSIALLLAELSPRLRFEVHRACIGSGIELPAFAARVVASADTHFQLPEITMGLIPGAGGTVSIPRRIGRQRTAYFALSGRRINAPTALAWGLIDAIRDDDDFD
ncbi:MAG: enoyl-CoA hydratase/isomerase family protein [Rhodocyclales bacterium]|nr:enoyl-CoA hydratase/isomerase family protein [Rhodocyclales bacterium]